MGNDHFFKKISCAPNKGQRELDRWDCVTTFLFMSSQGHDALEPTGEEKQLLE